MSVDKLFHFICSSNLFAQNFLLTSHLIRQMQQQHLLTVPYFKKQQYRYSLQAEVV